MPPHLQPLPTMSSAPRGKLGFNVDAAAITIALFLAALVRFGVLPRVGW